MNQWGGKKIPVVPVGKTVVNQLDDAPVRLLSYDPSRRLQNPVPAGKAVGVIEAVHILPVVVLLQEIPLRTDPRQSHSHNGHTRSEDRREGLCPRPKIPPITAKASRFRFSSRARTKRFRKSSRASSFIPPVWIRSSSPGQVFSPLLPCRFQIAVGGKEHQVIAGAQLPARMDRQHQPWQAFVPAPVAGVYVRADDDGAVPGIEGGLHHGQPYLPLRIQEYLPEVVRRGEGGREKNCRTALLEALLEQGGGVQAEKGGLAVPFAPVLQDKAEGDRRRVSERRLKKRVSR